MTTVLVSGANAIMGYGILKSLRMSHNPYKLIGISIYDDSIAPAFCDVFIKAPLTLSEGYLKWLEKTIKENNIDLIIPSFEIDVSFWSKNIDKLQKTGAKIVINNTELISLCEDKWAFYNVLKNQNCPYAIPTSLSSDFDELIKKFGLPFILKPRKGSGSRGIFRIYDKENFDLHKENIGQKLLVQPIVGKEDEEFTTGAFCDGEGGFYTIINFKRKLSKDGYTNNAEVIDSKKIEEAVSDICKILKPHGPTNFQFRIHKGVCQLLEINPRVSASTSIRSAFGYNESVMAVEYFLNGKIPIQPKIRKGKAIRYIEDFIFYS